MRRVPVVVTGSGSLVSAVLRVVEDVRSDLAGNEGFMLEPATELGPEPSVLVSTGGDGALARVGSAVRAGHAAVTADLAAVAADPCELAVLLADRRLGLAGALLPGLPLVEELARYRDVGAEVDEVELHGGARETLLDECVVVAALLGLELGREDVRVEASASEVELFASVGRRFPRIRAGGIRAPSGARTVVIRTEASLVTFSGEVGGDARTARALVADTVSFSRESDPPWRQHRRRVLPA